MPRWALSSAPTSAAAAVALDGAVHVTLIWNLLWGWVVGCYLQLVSDAGLYSTLCRWSDVSYIIKSLCSEHGRISASSFFLLLLRVGSRYFSFTLARASFQQRILSLATRRLNVGCTRSTVCGHHHRHRRVHWLPCISR